MEVRASLREASKDRLFLLHNVCLVCLINTELCKLTKQCVKVYSTKKLSGYKPAHKLNIWKVYWNLNGGWGWPLADHESAIQNHYFLTESPWHTLAALLCVFEISHVLAEVLLSGSSLHIFQKIGEIKLDAELPSKFIKVRRIINNWKRENCEVTPVYDFAMSFY